MTPAGPALHVDGALVDPASLPDLGGGASIEPVSKGFRIHFPDGTVLAVLSVSRWGVNAVVQPSDTLRSSGVGLLGPITPGGMGVPALPDGSQLPAAPDRPTRDTILYGPFADAWRVSDSTTLFDYDPGKSTATYTDRAFPSDVDRAALEAANASPRSRSAGRRTVGVCRRHGPGPALRLRVRRLRDRRRRLRAVVRGDAGPVRCWHRLLIRIARSVASRTGDGRPEGRRAPGPGRSDDRSGQHGVRLDHRLVARTPQLLAVDPATGAVKQHAGMRAATDLHFAAGSVWAAGQTTNANGQHCTVTRYDPQTLADQADVPIPCTNGSERLALDGRRDVVRRYDQGRPEHRCRSRVDPDRPCLQHTR